MAMYGNPHTPLLPHFPSNIWSNNTSGLPRCLGCSAIVSDQHPLSPKNVVEIRGSYSNLTFSDNCNSLTKQRLRSNINNPKTITTKHVGFANNLTQTNASLRSPAAISSPGNFVF
jgi:hypothetical protein